MITKAERKKLRELEGKATPGKWRYKPRKERADDGDQMVAAVAPGQQILSDATCGIVPAADGYLIAESRNQTLPLLDTLDEAVRLLRKLCPGGALHPMSTALMKFLEEVDGD